MSQHGVVGLVVSLAVGLGVGIAVGFAVGLAVGFTVGLSVGLAVPHHQSPSLDFAEHAEAFAVRLPSLPQLTTNDPVMPVKRSAHFTTIWLLTEPAGKFCPLLTSTRVLLYVQEQKTDVTML